MATREQVASLEFLADVKYLVQRENRWIALDCIALEQKIDRVPNSVPAGFAVDATALATVPGEGWVVRAPERPLEALAAAGAQALCPRGPGRPATIH